MHILTYLQARITALCLCVTLLCTFCSAQAGNYSADTATINKLFEASLKLTNRDSLIRIYLQMIPLAIKIKNDSISNGFSLKLGEYYLQNGDYAQALKHIKESFRYNGSLSYVDRANAYNHLGWIYLCAGEYVDASDNFYTALDILKTNPANAPTQLPDIYRYLGMVNFRLHQYQQALYYYNMSEDVARKNDHRGALIARALQSKGEYYTCMHQFDSAKKYFSEAVAIAERVDRPDIKADAYEGLGKAFMEAGDYSKAIYYLQWVIDKKNDVTVAIDASYYLAEALFRLKKFEKSEAILLTSLRMAERGRWNDNLIKGYSTLAAVYRATGRYRKAVECMDTLSMLKDSMVSVRKTQAINLMDIRYQTAKKDRQIANSQLLIAQQNSKIARKNMWIFIIGGSVLLLLLLSAGVYLHSLNRQRGLEKENKIGVLNAAIQGGDNERARLARELHDGIGGMLSAAMMRFSSMQGANAAVTTTSPAYAEAMNILREIGDEIRKTAHNLMPEVLLKQSLPDAIRAYCNGIQAPGLQIGFQHYGAFDDLPQNYKLNIYRIIQELVRNIVSHSEASRALVQLLRNKHSVIVSVEDNGRGFDESQVKAGQGLHNTRTRVRSIDGQFTLESQPGKGTTIFIEFTSIPS